MDACILVRVIPNSGKEVLDDIRRFKEVRKAFLSFGRYDIVVFVEAPHIATILDISTKINAIEGVVSTETFIEA